MRFNSHHVSSLVLTRASVAPNFFDFTTRPPETPLSWDGTWTNNTQGTGGNVAMNAQSSMRVIAAASGGGNMAAGDTTGQTVPPAAADYMDSFAFKPGFTGNLRITAVIYVDPGYSPPTDTDNHELELLLGCSSTAGNRTWISCTWNRDGARYMALMNGPANGFTVFTPLDSGGPVPFVSGDVWVGELYRSTNTCVTYINGAENLRSQAGDASNVAIASGSGLGIGSFRRSSGSSAANRYGFKSVLLETFP